jgi:hypothetical protein
MTPSLTQTLISFRRTLIARIRFAKYPTRGIPGSPTRRPPGSANSGASSSSPCRSVLPQAGEPATAANRCFSDHHSVGLATAMALPDARKPPITTSSSGALDFAITRSGCWSDGEGEMRSGPTYRPSCSVLIWPLGRRSHLPGCRNRFRAKCRSDRHGHALRGCRPRDALGQATWHSGHLRPRDAGFPARPPRRAPVAGFGAGNGPALPRVPPSRIVRLSRRPQPTCAEGRVR